MQHEIRTPKGKFYGVLNINTFVMTIIDGKNTRQMPLPKEGCSLSYQAGNSPVEVITIPAQSVFQIGSL